MVRLMRISFESKGDFNNTQRWLDKVAKTNMVSPLNQLASQGTRSLSANTPAIDTGETASGWQADIIRRGDVSEIIWTNNAHPETQANVARLIETGHGTRTGGYVPPRPYIKNAMTPVWSKIDGIVRELIR